MKNVFNEFFSCDTMKLSKKNQMFFADFAKKTAFYRHLKNSNFTRGHLSIFWWVKAPSSALLISRCILQLGQAAQKQQRPRCPHRKMYLEIRRADEWLSRCPLTPKLLRAPKQSWCHFEPLECRFHLSQENFCYFHQLTLNHQNRAFPNL